MGNVRVNSPSPGGAKEPILAAVLYRLPCATAQEKCHSAASFGRDFFRPCRGSRMVGADFPTADAVGLEFLHLPHPI
jgi:hypothetical protein